MKFILLFLLCSTWSNAGYTKIAETRANREIAMAESAIFWSLVTSKGAVGRQQCFEIQTACSDDRATLGLALIASKTTYSANFALVKLLRYRIDAGLSEDYTCYLLGKKKDVKVHLRNLRPKDIRGECVSEMVRATHQESMLLKGLKSDDICASESEIEERRQAFLTGLSNGNVCDAGDF